MAERVNQFIAASVYKFFNKLAPIYMGEIFIKSENIRTTRSSNDSNLFIPLRRNDYGKNCLSYLGATIWNCIDISIRNVTLGKKLRRIRRIYAEYNFIAYIFLLL